MNIKLVTLYNFMSYKKAEINFQEDGVYNLIGQNGVGKSAIRDAISWCLFGKSRVSGSGDELIRKNEKSMYVKLNIDIQNKNYNITRFKEIGQSTKLDIVGDESENGNTFKETQEHLLQILGFDFDVFHNTFCFEQNNADSFSQLNPKESKQLIMKLLQLNKYDDYEMAARVKLTQCITRLGNLTIKSQTIEELNKTQKIDIIKIQSEIDEKRKKYEELRQLSTKAKKINDLNKSLVELRQNSQKFIALSKCPTCLQDINETHKITIDNKFKAKIQIVLDEISSIGISDYSTIEEDSMTLLGDLSKLEFQLESYTKNANIEKSQSTTLNIEIENQRNEQATYEKLVTAFGRNGVPSLIIENCIPEIETISNTLLEELDIEMRLGLNLQRELKNGELGDTLDIVVYRDRCEMLYFNYSGGERFLIDLVLRLSLSVLLLRRKGCNNSTLIIDEGFGNLDKQNREKALKLISVINEKYSFKKILIISHISEIQDNIGKKIKIVKRNNESCIEV